LLQFWVKLPETTEGVMPAGNANFASRTCLKVFADRIGRGKLASIRGSTAQIVKEFQYKKKFGCGCFEEDHDASRIAGGTG